MVSSQNWRMSSDYGNFKFLQFPWKGLVCRQPFRTNFWVDASNLISKIKLLVVKITVLFCPDVTNIGTVSVCYLI